MLILASNASDRPVYLPDGSFVMAGDFRPCDCCGESQFEVVSVSRLVKVEGRESWSDLRVSVQCWACVSVQCWACFDPSRLPSWERGRVRRVYLVAIDMVSGAVAFLEEAKG
jgi:hypothetical protein